MSTTTQQLKLVEVAPQPRLRSGRARRSTSKAAGEQLALELRARDPLPQAGWLDRRAEVPPEEGPERESLFVFRERCGAAHRRELLAELSERLGFPPPRRDHLLDHLDEGRRLRAVVEERLLRVTFSGPRARERWLRAVQSFARDHGLVEPE